MQICFPFQTQLFARNIATGETTPIFLESDEPLEVLALQEGEGEDGSALSDAYLGDFTYIYGMPNNFTIVKED
jgi:hypothetical protein